ncbi:MAG: hypothetical protein IJ405_09800, partial [Lachnospiraceae bacterium]|nr:hypothetical protein [Lachnospiraceae bacterium]
MAVSELFVKSFFADTLSLVPNVTVLRILLRKIARRMQVPTSAKGLRRKAFYKRFGNQPIL